MARAFGKEAIALIVQGAQGDVLAANKRKTQDQRFAPLPLPVFF